MSTLRLVLDSPLVCQVELSEPDLFSLDQWKRNIDDMSAYVLKLMLHIRAPLFPGLQELISHVNSAGMRFDLRLSEHLQDKEELISRAGEMPSLQSLIIPLHGADRESHRFFGGIDDFSLAVSLVQKAVSLGLPVHVETVIGAHNRGTLDNLIGICMGMGVRRHLFTRHIGPVREGISLYRHELREILDTLDKKRLENPAIDFSGCFPRCFHQAPSKCLAGIASCAVDDRGNVKPCPCDTTVVGTMQTKSLRRIWKSREMKAFRETSFSECAACALLADCHGGCRAAASRLGFRRDPLIDPSRPGAEPGQTIPAWDEQGTIAINFLSRREAFGLILLALDRVIPLSAAGTDLIKRMENKPKVKEFLTSTGARGRDLLTLLYTQGFIDIR